MNAAGRQVPSANRGLKSPQGSMRGPSEETALAIVDFLTFSAPWSRMCDGLGVASPWFRSEALKGDVEAQRACAEWIVDEAFPGSGLRVDSEPRGFRNFYERHFRIVTPEGEQCGFVAMGGQRQRGTMCLELTGAGCAPRVAGGPRQRVTLCLALTGAGCAHVVAWAHVAAFLDTMNARITRVDLAHDDFLGRHTLADALRWHAAGLFNTGGRPPAVNQQGWDDGSGKTVYIGKNTGNQQLCVYEKGRQQGARDGDPQAAWVRWEGRFGAKYRDIPTGVLLDPAAYLIGHFPVLQGWLRATAMRMRTSAERAAANLHSAIRHAKRQTGALFNLVKKHVPEPQQFGDWIAQHVVRDRLPAWLSKNPFGADTIRFSFQT